MYKRFSRSPVLRGISFITALKYVTKAMILARLAIIGRLVGPTEIGWYQLALLVVAISEVFTETGVNIVLLKHPKKLEEYIHTAWVVSFIRGTLICAAIVVASPWLSHFFGNSALTSFLPLSATIPFIRGWINPAIITFQQELRFGNESLFRLGLQTIDVIVGFAFAWMMQSALGLIVGILVSALCEVVFSFMAFPKIPNPLKAKFSQLVGLYQETKVIVGNGILHYLTENIDDFLIGKWLGATSLGLYHTAYRITSTFTNDFGSNVGQILYPVYARLHQDKKPVKPLFQKSTIGTLSLYALISIPFFFISDPLIRFFFGAEWAGAIPLVRILFLAGVAKSLATQWNPLAILAHQLHHYVVINTATIILLSAGIFWFSVYSQRGIQGAGWAVLLAMIITLPYSWIVVQKSVRSLDNDK